MKVYIADMLKSNGASLNVGFVEKLEGLDQEESSIVFTDPVEFTGTIVNEKGILRLRGHVKAKYRGTCFRCLKEVTGEIGADVSEEFLSAAENTDKDAFTYEGNYVTLDKAIKDNIILGMPMKLVCSEACKGLCPVCGTDLNERACDCRVEPVNTRMESLKRFFDS